MNNSPVSDRLIDSVEHFIVSREQIKKKRQIKFLIAMIKKSNIFRFYYIDLDIIRP